MIDHSSYEQVLQRRGEITRNSVGIDYADYEWNAAAFDYEGLMAECAVPIEQIAEIQYAHKIGRTPLLELANLTKAIRTIAPPGCGARIFIKDEAANASGSFKARRASMVIQQALEGGYRGVIAATSGNYGAAVASQAAIANLHTIVLQEVFDSSGRGQPEILEKWRACMAYGAEVWRLTVGPELFYIQLLLLEETGYFNASLYTPYAVAGIETLGWEIGHECVDQFGKPPDVVLVTHAGGGNITGTARGLQKAGCETTRVVAVSVDLAGLHMASDHDFNRKSFTTGHTGFSIPFSVDPDRVDVPRSAARGLRYLDQFVTISQGEVFYATEVLAQLEGMERGPAGNTSLAAAFAIGQEMERDQILVVQETEYTGAGKHPTAQLTFAREIGIEVTRGDPRDDAPGQRIVVPEHLSQFRVTVVDLDRIRASYLRRQLERLGDTAPDERTIQFFADDLNVDTEYVHAAIQEGSGVSHDSF